MKNKYFGKFLLDFIYKNTDSEYQYESDDLDDIKRECDKLIENAIDNGYSFTFCNMGYISRNRSISLINSPFL